MSSETALIKCLQLTVFDEANDCAVLQGNVHVEVLNVHVHFTDALLILLTLLVQFTDHLLQKGDIFRVLHSGVPVPNQS